MRAVSSSDSGPSEIASALRLPQLRPRRADDKQRHACDPLRQLVDEVKQGIVGPMQVLEDEHGRAPLGKRLEEAAPGGEAFAAVLAAARLVGCEPEQRPQVRRHPVTVRLRQEVGEHRCQFRLADIATIGPEHADLRLDDLAESPEAHTLAVRQRAALPPSNDLLVRIDNRKELADQPALAYPRDAGHGHKLRLALASRTLERAD